MLPVRGEGESRERDEEKQEAPLRNGERGLDNWGILVIYAAPLLLYGHA